MAVFVAANPNVAVDMSQLFAFEPTFGQFTIDSIDTATLGMALVADVVSTPGDPFSILYSNSNGTEEFEAFGTTPVSGSFDKMEIFIDGALQGTLSGIAQGFGNFSEINLVQAYKVLLGDDTITGSNQDDNLFTGDGGTDSVDGKGGDDQIGMAATAFAPFHSIDGGSGTDTINAFSNVFTADKVLDLRNASLLNVEGVSIEGGVTVRLLGSQIGNGLFSSAAEVSKSFGSGNGTLEVILNAPGAANLSGFKVNAGVSISVFGSTGADTISGTSIGETIRAGAGADTVNGNGGNDTFFVAGTLAEFDTMNGGTGTDTLFVEGGGPLTLNGFNAASQLIEKWDGNGQALNGNGNANVFNLAGLTGMSGLTSINGLGGKDTITGSKFADTIAASGAEAEFDTMNGGLGTDTFRVLGSGPLTLNGFNAASQSIEKWAGNGQGLLGNGGNNSFDLSGLASMSGLAFIDGGDGDDTIIGSDFADVIRGGAGKDTMTGGLGGDRFDFDAVAEIGKKKGLLDLITDWGDGDRIDLSTIDANGSKKGDKAFKFLKKEGADFTKAGQLGFDQKKGVTYVEGDTNGDGKADFKLQVTGTIDFEKADFVL